MVLEQFDETQMNLDVLGQASDGKPNGSGEAQRVALLQLADRRGVS